MRIGLLVAFLLFALPLHASGWLGAGVGFRFERDSEGDNLSTRYPLQVLGGKRFNQYEAVGEFDYLTRTTGNSTLSIERQQYIFLAEMRYHAFTEEQSEFLPYFMAALGGYFEKVNTTFLGATDRRTSKPQLLGGVGIGVWGLAVSKLRVGAEFRVLGARDFDPQALLDLGLRIGYEF